MARSSGLALVEQGSSDGNLGPSVQFHLQSALLNNCGTYLFTRGEPLMIPLNLKGWATFCKLSRVQDVFGVCLTRDSIDALEPKLQMYISKESGGIYEMSLPFLHKDFDEFGSVRGDPTSPDLADFSMASRALKQFLACARDLSQEYFVSFSPNNVAFTPVGDAGGLRLRVPCTPSMTALCPGCIEEQSNQIAHFAGCLAPDAIESESKKDITCTSSFVIAHMNKVMKSLRLSREFDITIFSRHEIQVSCDVRSLGSVSFRVLSVDYPDNSM